MGRRLFFVGVTEYYHESMCVLHDKIRPENTLPEWCNCKDPKAWSTFTSHHDPPGKVRPHSLEDLSETDLKIISQLTDKDKVLYGESLRRLSRELHDLERRRNTTILCANMKNPSL